MKRTNHCCELTKDDAGKTVTLAGWIDSIRDHGGIWFVDLRDREGLTQIVLDPSHGGYADHLNDLKPESVIEVTGAVKPRSKETINPNLKTGEIEVHVESLVIHNISATPPFPLDDKKAELVNEDLRLNFRYLDLRRPSNLRILRLRHRASKTVRDYLDELDFIDIETPILFKSTPEGAREFLVPCRLSPGQFYALSQSPQQLKQMLMVAGVERYYQIARCFRDEDLRADRQPEFTQIDIEMSFIESEDIFAVIEGMFKRLWSETIGVDVSTPFPRLKYREVMDRFGTDKPDTRYGIELVDLCGVFENSGFKVFANAIEKGGAVKAINAKGLADITQGEMKALEEAAKLLGARGLAFIKSENGELKSPILKFFSDEELAALKEKLEVEEGDLVFFAADAWDRACTILGHIRQKSSQLLVKRGKLKIPENQYNFLWVVDFPLMLFDPEEDRYISAHHPFTSPVVEDIPKLETDPKSVRGQHYDIVLNGVELGGGSIRIHHPKLQRKVFEQFLKIPSDVVQSRFGYLLKALSYGAPPHGGIALGFDRMVAILAGKSSIRDVIAFPKTQKGQDLMSQTPGPVTPKQLRDLHITTVDVSEQES